MDALLADLNDWEMVATQQDAELRQSNAEESAPDDLPGLRSRRVQDPSVKPAAPEFIPQEKQTKPEVIHASKDPGSGARHTYDNYQKKWDKWDNAEFIEDVLTEEAKRDEDDAAEEKKRQDAAPAKPKVSDLVRAAPVKKGLNSVEKKILADKEKEKGNECFKTGEHDTAIEYYTRGLSLHENAIIYANRAMAYLRMDRAADAVKDCDSALRVDPSYKKALFRRGLAYKALASYDEAADDLKAALSADPDNKQILKELSAVERGQSEARKNRFKRMAVEETDGDDRKKPAAAAAAPKKTFKRIAVEEDSDSDSSSEEEKETQQQAAPPVVDTQARRRIVVEESSSEEEEEAVEEVAVPAKPAFTRVAVEESSSEEEEEEPAPFTTGAKFLAENKLKKGVVALASGLQYKVLRAGDGDSHPLPNSPCSCHYEGRCAKDWCEFCHFSFIPPSFHTEKLVFAGPLGRSSTPPTTAAPRLPSRQTRSLVAGPRRCS